MAGSSSTEKRILDENDEDANTITLDEFIEEEQRLEIDAEAVLGPSDDKNCTYSQGYVKRQALYACITCNPLGQENSKTAGVCLACTYHCHEGHDLVELYTKRNFKCDCGNRLFNGKKCNLVPEKEDINVDNKYNQNFRGVYCICARPYPDPDDSVSDEMLQCIICEDWYHTRHIGCEMPSEENFAELICGPCTDRLTFLSHYMGYLVTKPNNIEGQGSSKVDVVNVETDVNGTDPAKEDLSSNKPESSLVTSTNNKQDCILLNSKAVIRNGKGATFWPDNFRTILCKCDSCKDLYEKLDVPWIIDPLDTVQAYEEKGNKENENRKYSSSDQVFKVLAGMDRYQQVEAIHNYNELKSHLFEYLAKFAENKKVVREEDIREFFTQMQARKRQKVETPYTCR